MRDWSENFQNGFLQHSKGSKKFMLGKLQIRTQSFLGREREVTQKILGRR